MRVILAVAAGSGLGAMARVLVVSWVGEPAVSGVPLGVMLVNTLGSWVIGLAASLVGPEGRLLVAPAWRQFIMAGLCGGFTTFSLFSLQTFQLLRAGLLIQAILYSALTLALALIAVWVGLACGNLLNRLPGGLRAYPEGGSD